MQAGKPTWACILWDTVMYVKLNWWWWLLFIIIINLNTSDIRCWKCKCSLTCRLKVLSVAQLTHPNYATSMLFSKVHQTIWASLSTAIQCFIKWPKILQVFFYMAPQFLIKWHKTMHVTFRGLPGARFHVTEPPVFLSIASQYPISGIASQCQI